MYMMAKHLHLTAVGLSILLFVVRFLLLQFNPTMAQKKLLKVLPHIVYTVLLLSALWLCFQLSLYPFINGWATAKLAGLVGFVIAGIYTTNLAKKPSQQWIGFVITLLILMATLHVAYAK